MHDQRGPLLRDNEAPGIRGETHPQADAVLRVPRLVWFGMHLVTTPSHPRQRASAPGERRGQ